MKPNKLSEPTFRNARRSKSLYMCASMIEDKCLRVEDTPEHVLECLAPDISAATSALNGRGYLRDLALGGGMHQSCQEQPVRDLAVGQRFVGEPVVQGAVFSGDLVL